ncbi:uncharacterized protein LOC111050711 isoform X2 [Nilaparvata lugens]|uniref:uncharacterized protein LOC111050711 isoform X2 n=1 Tax=Nilaparvata lugens TaxID=108931 RepID=UPI00193D7B11|nr:uncharacterized protein LOC111050711 isoform X2 [Nilaparvata lugens]
MKSVYGLMLLMIWAGLEITEVVSTGKFDFEVFDVNGDKKLDQSDLKDLRSFGKFQAQFTTEAEMSAIIDVLNKALSGKTSISSSDWNSATIQHDYEAKISA